MFTKTKLRLQQYLRRRMNPIPGPYAREVKQKLALVYTFCAWNALGLLLWMVLKESYPMTKAEEKRPGLYYARLLQVDDVHVVKIKGLTVTEQYDIKGKPQLMPEAHEFEEKAEQTV